MPIFLFKKKLAEITQEHKKKLLWLGNSFRHSALWHFHREAVARGVAVGFLVGFIPLPIQTILAIVIGASLRANLAVAILMTWFSNPFTLIPLTLLIYKIGSWVLPHGNALPIISVFSALPTDLSWGAIQNIFQLLGKKYLIGLFIISIVASILSYAITHILWQLSSKIKIKKQRR
jgi:uncharacterized protein